MGITYFENLKQKYINDYWISKNQHEVSSVILIIIAMILRKTENMNKSEEIPTIITEKYSA